MGVSGSTTKRHHFEILIMSMWLGFSDGPKNNINFVKR